VAGLARQRGAHSSPGPSHRRVRNAIWNATPSNAAQYEGGAQRGLCSSGIFQTRTAILEDADWATLCAKTSMASLPVIAALEWGLSVISPCAECTLSAVRSYESSLDRDCNAIPPTMALACLPRIVRRNAFGNSAIAIRPRARSPEPAVFIDTQFRLVRGASNDAAAHPDCIGVNRPKAHSAPTRLAVVLNCQKPDPNCER
jgi:hypothetical protein